MQNYCCLLRCCLCVIRIRSIEEVTKPMEQQPIVVHDPRFVAGRQTVGQPASIEIFALLLEEARAQFGDESLEAAPAYYEYGNALFRVSQRKDQQRQQEEQQQTAKTNTSSSSSREAAAAAAERRAKQQQQASTSSGDDGAEERKKPAAANDKESSADKEKDGEDSDVLLALEMMETAFAILDRAASDDDKNSDELSTKYADWVREQVPRVLTGLGDVQSALHRHADAAHAYLHALEHRQEALQAALAAPQDNDQDRLYLLTCRRRVVEVNTLIVEELLACDLHRDVVTSEAKLVLVEANKVVEYATGYYEKAREELQEAVLLLGQLAAMEGIAEEKENVCFAATLVMAAGEALAAIGDETNRDSEPTKKKAKTA